MKKDPARLITGKTRVCGVIGDPVEHSLSPAMHNAAYRKLGLDYVYLPFRVSRHNLKNAIDGMRGLAIRGLNVTIPHKTTVLPLLDAIDDMARRIGAVNTIVNDSGILTGYNTDAEGFMRSVTERGVTLTGKRIAVVGAGGAARAITFALMSEGAIPTILNRSPARAADLAKQLRHEFSIPVDSLPLEEVGLRRALDPAYMLVNTTSVGMSPEIEASPIPAHLLRPGLVVYDIVYSPVKTRLLSDAEKAGAVTMGGVDMLARQGAAAFEKWTGTKAPLETMREEALRLLRETS